MTGPDIVYTSSGECDACGTSDNLRSCSIMTGDPDVPVCRMCVLIWYDRGITDPKRIGFLARSLRERGFVEMSSEAYSCLAALDP